MAQNPEATANAEGVCPACGQAVHTSGAVDYATVIGGRVPTEIVIARLDGKASAAFSAPTRKPASWPAAVAR